MADSILERVAQYLVAQLEAPGKPDGLLVGRDRSLPLDEDHLPAVIVYYRGESVERLAERMGMTRRKAVFRVEKRVMGEPLDRLNDPVRQWVVQQFMVDLKLGGLARGITELGTPPPDQDTKDLVVGAEATDFEVMYYTKANDLTCTS